MNWKESITVWCLLLMNSWTTTSMSSAIRTCEVHPRDVIVAVGDRVSLNCSASPGLSVVSWQLGADVLTKIVVFTAPVYRKDGTIRTEKFVATDRGYAVDDAKESEAILEIKQTSLTHAGSYYCTCSDDKMTAALGAVVVIDPKLSTNASVCGGESVAINCSITSSDDISYVMAIEDSFGQTVASKNGSSSCNDVLTSSCQLTYVIAANDSTNETFSCSVNATTNKNIQFSKVLKTSIVYSKDCSGNSQNSTEDGNVSWITIIVVSCCCVVIFAFAMLALFMILRRKHHPNSSGYDLLCLT